MNEENRVMQMTTKTIDYNDLKQLVSFIFRNIQSARKRKVTVSSIEYHQTTMPKAFRDYDALEFALRQTKLYTRYWKKQAHEEELTAEKLNGILYCKKFDQTISPPVGKPINTDNNKQRTMSNVKRMVGTTTTTTVDPKLENIGSNKENEPSAKLALPVAQPSKSQSLKPVTVEKEQMPGLGRVERIFEIIKVVFEDASKEGYLKSIKGRCPYLTVEDGKNILYLWYKLHNKTKEIIIDRR